MTVTVVVVILVVNAITYICFMTVTVVVMILAVYGAFLSFAMLLFNHA